MVSSWIINLVAKEIGGSIIYAKTTKDMWKDLKNQFVQENGSRIFQLHKELYSPYARKLTRSDYYTRFKCLWDELLEFN